MGIYLWTPFCLFEWFTDSYPRNFSLIFVHTQPLSLCQNWHLSVPAYGYLFMVLVASVPNKFQLLELSGCTSIANFQGNRLTCDLNSPMASRKLIFSGRSLLFHRLVLLYLSTFSSDHMSSLLSGLQKSPSVSYRQSLSTTATFLADCLFGLSLIHI